MSLFSCSIYWLHVLGQTRFPRDIRWAVPRQRLLLRSVNPECRVQVLPRRYSTFNQQKAFKEKFPGPNPLSVRRLPSICLGTRSTDHLPIWFPSNNIFQIWGEIRFINFKDILLCTNFSEWIGLKIIWGAKFVRNERRCWRRGETQTKIQFPFASNNLKTAAST